MSNLDEYKEITLLKYNWGPDLGKNLDLSTILIKITNFSEINNEKIFLNKPILVLKSEGLQQYVKQEIGFDSFNNIFENIENINFEKMYSENSTGDDGWELETELKKEMGLLKYSKRIELFSPDKHEETIEINKLLKVYNEILDIANCEEYLNLIDVEMRKNLMDFENEN